MARKRQPKEPKTDDTKDISDAVVVPAGETGQNSSDEVTDVAATDQPDTPPSTPPAADKTPESEDPVSADEGGDQAAAQTTMADDTVDRDLIAATDGDDTFAWEDTTPSDMGTDTADSDATGSPDSIEAADDWDAAQADKPDVTLDDDLTQHPVAASDGDDTLAGQDTAEGAGAKQDSNSFTEAEDHPQDIPPASGVPGSAEAPATPAPPQQVIVRRGGFVPLLLGGIVAAAIGFGAARYVLPEGWPWPGAADDALEQDVAALSTRIDDLANTVDAIDLAPIEDQASGLGGAVDTLTTRLDEIATRLDELEQRPVPQENGDGGGDTSALSAELRDLQASVESQRADLDALMSVARAQEEQAETEARQALARAALARVRTALDTGSDFSGAVTDLRDIAVDVPEPLAGAADGVPTLSELQAEFPDAARSALSAARRSSGEAAGLGGFLRTQLGVRSLEPQEGDSADAILSRAEAALRDGRLADALAEIDTLPPEGQAPLADWVARAEKRQSAVSVANELTQSLSAD